MSALKESAVEPTILLALPRQNAAFRILIFLFSLLFQNLIFNFLTFANTTAISPSLPLPAWQKIRTGFPQDLD